MEPRLFSYIWRHTRSQQIWVLMIILISLPFYFMSLDLPKLIVNGPIQGRGFPSAEATQRFFELKVSLPSFLSGASFTLFSGFELERLPYLIGLSLLFLLLVCVNGLFKFYINTYKGRLGERMLRRMRFELVDRALRFTPSHLRSVKSAEVATMVKDEVEPLGGFIGDAYATPMFLAGQALTAMIFILVQSVWLGLVALSIVVAQAVLIPRLRKRLLELGRRQQLTARELAGRVSEVVDGAIEVRTNDASNFERADIASRLGRIFFIRYELFQRKFFVKFLNNFLAQLTPFLFFLIGGYLALRGSLDIGQLVAVIAAYKELPPPIKELIDWDQQRQDVQIKYGQVIEQFDDANSLPAGLQAPIANGVAPINGAIEVAGVTIEDESGGKVLEGASLSLRPGERVAVVGEANSGAEALGDALLRLAIPASGQIRLGAETIDKVPDAVIGRRFGYVGSDTFLRNGTVRDSLLYALSHYPTGRHGKIGTITDTDELREAEVSGNPTYALDADWIDYEAAGVKDAADLNRRIIEVLRLTELNTDAFELGLKTRIEEGGHAELAGRVLAARRELRARLGRPPLSALVEPFDPAVYCRQLTIAENLLFGTTLSAELGTERLPQHRYVRKVLSHLGLDEELFEIGRKIATTISEVFSGLPSGHRFFEQIAIMKSDELPLYQAALKRVGGRSCAEAAPEDQALFLRLAFAYQEPVLRMGLLTDDLSRRIVEARETTHTNLPKSLAGAIAFYRPDVYNAGATLEDNILFGRVVQGMADGPERVREAIREVLEEMELTRAVKDAGLLYNVGPGGKRLSLSQRQKLGLARALLKRPDVLVVNRGLSALSPHNQRAIAARVLEAARGSREHPPFAVVWITGDGELAKDFDRAILVKNGRIVGDGEPQRLLQKPAPAGTTAR